MTPPTSQKDRPEGTAMNGSKLRERLSKGEAITMFNPHHVSPGLSARLVELGADSIFVDCEHGSWGFEDVRIAAQVIRGAGGAAIVRPDSHQRSLLIRYLNAGAEDRKSTRLNSSHPSISY